MLFEWLEPRTIYIILHLFGVALGAGGAYMSDAMFFSSVKDKVLSKTELRFLQIGSIAVWVGLLLLYVSGALLFSLDPAGYLASSKFIVKMIVVFIITINGFIFHLSHFPRMQRHADAHYPSSDEFTRNKKFLVASGAVSLTSWTIALILGALPSIPYSIPVILGSYLIIEIVAVGIALLLARRLV